MHKEERGEEVQGPGPDGGEGVGEATIEEPSQGKVEVAGEGEPNLSVHLAQGPLHAVPSILHHLSKGLHGGGERGGRTDEIVGKEKVHGIRRR